MMKYKQIQDGFVEAVGTNIGGNKISEEEYENILSIIHNAPTPPDGYMYKLRADTLEWEMFEAPPTPEPSEDATEQDYQNALEQMGVNFNEIS